MKVLEIVAYKTSNEKLFESESKAERHQQDIIGELLDGFLPYDERGHMTRIDRHGILMKQLTDKELKSKITELYLAVSFGSKE